MIRKTAGFMMNVALERNGLIPVLIPAYLETRLVKASREVYRTLDCSPMLDLMAEARAFTDTILFESAPVGVGGRPPVPAQAV